MLTLEATWILTQELDPGGTTLVGSCKGFNNLSRLVMLSIVHQFWPAAARFEFNCYRHWENLICCQPVDAPVVILSLEGVTHGGPPLDGPV